MFSGVLKEANDIIDTVNLFIDQLLFPLKSLENHKFSGDFKRNRI